MADSRSPLNLIANNDPLDQVGTIYLADSKIDGLQAGSAIEIDEPIRGIPVEITQVISADGSPGGMSIDTPMGDWALPFLWWTLPWSD